ncbi:MAG: hypothetical protein B7Z62_02155 [Deltaproteobacteria bacterium 37-65-8]|nr:MAG: hypothetical protein B7Z62_02155 [Deltaproteobacteria bacterium 37-65-8]
MLPRVARAGDAGPEGELAKGPGQVRHREPAGRGSAGGVGLTGGGVSSSGAPPPRWPPPGPAGPAGAFGSPSTRRRCRNG